jgi:pyrimidine operon attenuation protein/uracil phosphoribosyltransferase
MPTLDSPARAPLDAQALYEQLRAQVAASLPTLRDPAIVGIHSGGAWLATRLARDLQLEARLGFIDVSFYRDDYAKKGLHPDVKPTSIGFDVNGATIVLVDDVLYTGRTTRAAINVLFDFGRPQRIMLAALADRGGRELPVAADFVGARVELAPGQSLSLSRNADQSLTLAVEEEHV